VADPSRDRDALLAELEALHAEVDAAAGALVARRPVRCGVGCTECCVDDLTIWTIEAARIRRGAAHLLAHGEPHPPLACAFLDPDGACRIYEQRPYVCRTQGLPLRWWDRDCGGNVTEYRDICPLNEECGPPVEQLAREDCWEIGPVEERLASLQARFDGFAMERVPLRALFAPASADQAQQGEPEE